MKIHGHLKKYIVDGKEDMYACPKLTMVNGRQYGYLQHPKIVTENFWYDPERQIKVDNPLKQLK